MPCIFWNKAVILFIFYPFNLLLPTQLLLSTLTEHEHDVEREASAVCKLNIATKIVYEVCIAVEVANIVDLTFLYPGCIAPSLVAHRSTVAHATDISRSRGKSSLAAN